MHKFWHSHHIHSQRAYSRLVVCLIAQGENACQQQRVPGFLGSIPGIGGPFAEEQDNNNHKPQKYNFK